YTTLFRSRPRLGLCERSRRNGRVSHLQQCSHLRNLSGALAQRYCARRQRRERELAQSQPAEKRSQLRSVSAARDFRDDDFVLGKKNVTNLPRPRAGVFVLLVTPA